MRPCCCSARPAPARSSSPARFTSAARAAHRSFVVVNCGALPAALIESELFGHERGAFTGAHTAQAGRFELANGGTLFLDEIGELPLELQPKLLRVLQEGQLERLGSTAHDRPSTCGSSPRPTATSQRRSVRARFRRDLYYRLNVFPITLPALRERREDLPALVQHLVDRLSRELGKPIDAYPARHVMRRSSSTTGRATSASWRTSSSRRSSSRPATR